VKRDGERVVVVLPGDLGFQLGGLP
jgi:hypothetical protein